MLTSSISDSGGRYWLEPWEYWLVLTEGEGVPRTGADSPHSHRFWPYWLAYTRRKTAWETQGSLGQHPGSLKYNAINLISFMTMAGNKHINDKIITKEYNQYQHTSISQIYNIINTSWISHFCDHIGINCFYIISCC